MNPAKNLDVQVNSLFFVVDRPPNPDWHLTNYLNNRWYVLAYAQSGCVHYTFDTEPVSVKKGNIVLIKQNQLYNAQSDPKTPWAFYSVAFSLSCLDQESQRIIDELPNIFTSSGSSHMVENFSELNRIWSGKEAGYLIKCRSLILDILYILLSDEFRRSKVSAHYSTIEQIVNMMRNHYTESFSLEELCAMAGLSSSHFRMLFKEVTGMTTVQFQNHLKIDRAKDLIVSHDCNVTEAAHAVGFNDVYYFSKMFRQITGKNPSEFLR